MRHKKKPIYIRRHKTPPWWLTKTKLRWFLVGLLSALAIIILIGAFSPIRMAAFVTLLSDRDPVMAESTAKIAEASMLARDVFALINEIRQKYGCPLLEWDDGLANKAIAHSKVMAEKKVLTHSTYGSGENIIQLIGYDLVGPQDFVRGWLDSPLHKKNLLGDYLTTGVGLFKDGNTWWGTQIFGY